jgi:Collagen triple helix repeat (20 copies)
METWLHFIDSLALLAIVWLLASRRLVGPAGAPGPRGLEGQDGRDGRDGLDGILGSDGQDGAPGRDGKDGADGRDGAPGRDGKDGADGRDGMDAPVQAAGVPMVQILRNGAPYHRAPVGSPLIDEAKRGRRGLSVVEG